MFMNIVHSSLVIASLIQLTSAQEFFSSLSLSSIGGSNLPNDGWTATIGFALSSNVIAGLEFDLDLSNVYTVKFNAAETSVFGYTGSTAVIECTATQGGNVANSVLTCKTLDSVDQLSSISGSFDIRVFFTVGGTVSTHSIAAANAYVVGENTITFGSLSTQVTFSGLDSIEYPYNFARTLGPDLIENYYLFPKCEGGKLGGLITISYGDDGDSQISNCNSVQYTYPTALNPWNFPTSFFAQTPLRLCGNKEITVFISEIAPTDYQFSITAFQTKGENPTLNRVDYDLTCNGVPTYKGNIADLLYF